MLCFFFSSRRRHTRSDRDWSSDVCSSDWFCLTFNELSARQNLFERALLETRAALDALKGLSESNPDEVLVPVGGGVLLRSPPPNAEDVLLNVGANVVVQRKRVEAVAFLEGRAREIENSIVSLLSQRNQIAARLEADRQALQAIVSRQNQKD